MASQAQTVSVTDKTGAAWNFLVSNCQRALYLCATTADIFDEIGI